jgi:hypothetical protein
MTLDIYHEIINLTHLVSLIRNCLITHRILLMFSHLTDWELLIFSFVIAIFTVKPVSICPAAHANPKPSVGIQSTSDVLATPTGMTNTNRTTANTSGSGASTIDISSVQTSTADRASSTTNTTATSGGLVGTVTTAASVQNTPGLVQSSGSSRAGLTGGSGNAATNAISTSNLSPSGNSARGFAQGRVSGTR